MVSALEKAGQAIQFTQCDDIVGVVAEALATGQVIAWFQGRMEYGPRALGHRSILANPQVAGMKDVVNARIKHREQFRPFAGAVPLDCASDYFEIKGESPCMQFVLPVVESAQPRIPAIVHHGTCRVQTVAEEDDPIFHRLLRAFGNRTGIPVLLNTSFNDADEPIVCSPDHAIATFLRTDLDALALGPFLVTKPRRELKLVAKAMCRAECRLRTRHGRAKIGGMQMAKSRAPVRRSRMPCVPRVSAAVLPSNTAMSAAGRTQEKGLSCAFY